MNILFLDYDGVVNTPQWRPHPVDPSRMLCTYNFPRDNKVNDFQCVQWISEFCQKYDYSIVVTSSRNVSSMADLDRELKFLERPQIIQDTMELHEEMRFKRGLIFITKKTLTFLL